jgi:hypothetical protein
MIPCSPRTRCAHTRPAKTTHTGAPMRTTTRIDFADGSAVPDLNVTWIHGSESAKHNTDPDIQVHVYDEHTYILRQNMAVHFEAPFMFLLFGRSRALLLDTGATANPEYFPLRRTVDSITDAWLAEHPSGRLRPARSSHALARGPHRSRSPVRRPAQHNRDRRATRSCRGVLRLRRQPRGRGTGRPGRPSAGLLAHPWTSHRGGHVLRSIHRDPVHRRHDLPRTALRRRLASLRRIDRPAS